MQQGSRAQGEAPESREPSHCACRHAPEPNPVDGTHDRRSGREAPGWPIAMKRDLLRGVAGSSSVASRGSGVAADEGAPQGRSDPAAPRFISLNAVRCSDHVPCKRWTQGVGDLDAAGPSQADGSSGAMSSIARTLILCPHSARGVGLGWRTTTQRRPHPNFAERSSRPEPVGALARRHCCVVRTRSWPSRACTNRRR